MTVIACHGRWSPPRLLLTTRLPQNNLTPSPPPLYPTTNKGQGNVLTMCVYSVVQKKNERVSIPKNRDNSGQVSGWGWDKKEKFKANLILPAPTPAINPKNVRPFSINVREGRQQVERRRSADDGNSGEKKKKKKSFHATPEEVKEKMASSQFLFRSFVHSRRR